MSPRSLAFVGIRLAAVYAVLTAALSALAVAAGMIQWWIDPRALQTRFLVTGTSILGLLVQFGVAIYLWRSADSLSQRVARGCAEDVHAGPLDTESLLSVLIAAIGIYTAVDHIPLLFNQLYLRQTLPPGVNAPFDTLIWSLTAIILGVGITIGAQGIASLVTRLRYMGAAR